MNLNKDKNISLDQVFFKIGELTGEIKQINQKLDFLIKNYNGRINKLEDDTATIKAKAGIISAIISFFVSVLLIIIGFFRR